MHSPHPLREGGCRHRPSHPGKPVELRAERAELLLSGPGVPGSPAIARSVLNIPIRSSSSGREVDESAKSGQVGCQQNEQDSEARPVFRVSRLSREARRKSTVSDVLVTEASNFDVAEQSGKPMAMETSLYSDRLQSTSVVVRKGKMLAKVSGFHLTEDGHQLRCSRVGAQST